MYLRATVSLAFLALTCSANAASNAGFQSCSNHFVLSTTPRLSGAQGSNLRALCYEGFAVLYSGSTKTPVYVAQHLSRDRLLQAKGLQRSDRFFADARLPYSERAQLEDYRNNPGYDRGHMAAAADMYTQQAMEQSFSLANVVPQASQNNRKAWASIEKATRKYVMRAQGDVFVITGPVFTEPAIYLRSGHVRVPSYIYKLVYDATDHRAWAHWIANTDEARPGRPISYSELVARTGIEFLPGVRTVD